MKTQKDEGRSLNAIIEKAIKNYWEYPALSDLGGISYPYKDVAVQIAKLHIMFDAAGMKAGDKVAICGKNSSNWAITFLACLTKGMVAVPILHEFKPETIHHLVNHCEARMLFTDAAIWESLDKNNMPDLTAVIFMTEFGMPFSRSEQLTETRNNINEHFGKLYPYEFSPANVDYYHDSPEDLAIINYTSGSTGMSKGVMLPYRSVLSNIRYCIGHLHFLKPGDGMVNMLPLAHLFGMVIEMLHPFVKGCHCHFVTRVPSPNIILKAFAEVRPKLIITVPLVLEKIIRKRVFPEIEKPMMRALLRMPIVKGRVLRKIRQSLVDAFGGNVLEIIIGGAALNPEVESFLKRIDFPYTVGYGMTECGPLVSYSPPEDFKPHSVGRIVDRMECRVDSPDPATVPGNLWVKGDNVMLGYYKNEKATLEVMPNGDGWMNSGDMCRIGADGSIYISGRSKTMILGPSGQNIYPEEIEAVLNAMPLVSESLVIDNGGKLEALIYPDFEDVSKRKMGREELEKLMEENIATLNKEVPAYSKVASFKLFDQEFEKTPKRSIKRFLYQP